jgi:hypothetical protein
MAPTAAVSRDAAGTGGEAGASETICPENVIRPYAIRRPAIIIALSDMAGMMSLPA